MKSHVRIVRTGTDPDRTRACGRRGRACIPDTRATCGPGAGAGAGMQVEEEVVQSEGAKRNLGYTNHINHTNRTDRKHDCTRTDHDDRRVTPYQKRSHRGYIG